MNVPDPEIFHSEKSTIKLRSDHKFILLYPGNLGEHFGVDTAIRAMGLLHDRYPDVVLWIVGTGQEESKLIQLRNDLGLESSVLFSRRRFPIDKIPSVIQQADVGIVPKRGGLFSDEALSTKLLEFAMMGLPVIVSRTSASERYFDSRMVHYFEPDNEEDLARAIADLHGSSALRKRLAKNASRFTRMVNWEKYRQVYFDLLGSIQDDLTKFRGRTLRRRNVEALEFTCHRR
jgi:glycosyltransferase involved in cell wall biosynthesis